MTSLLQPMDQGVIHNLKQHYRKQILINILTQMEENKPLMSINLLDAIQNLNKVWNVNVKAETIANCFRKSGFSKDGMQTQTNISDEEDWDEEDCVSLSELRALWASYSAVANIGASFEDYVNVDDGACTMGTPSDDDILQSVLENYGVPDISGLKPLKLLPTNAF